ncbi:hypothetical protein AAC387_Pa05g2148 [Persea americana]
MPPSIAPNSSYRKILHHFLRYFGKAIASLLSSRLFRFPEAPRHKTVQIYINQQFLSRSRCLIREDIE